MRRVIFSGIAALAAASTYLSFQLAKSFDKHPSTYVAQPDYTRVVHHLDDAIYALSSEQSENTVAFFGFNCFDISASKNAHPAAARSELEHALKELPESGTRKAVQHIYDSLPTAAISSATYDKERKELRTIRDNLTK